MANICPTSYDTKSPLEAKNFNFFFSPIIHKPSFIFTLDKVLHHGCLEGKLEDRSILALTLCFWQHLLLRREVEKISLDTFYPLLFASLSSLAL